ncbi:cupin domain-containing protein [Exiguobacterium sp. s102]|uniref:cupin domain-containing protein n=1 Tax=Exiguobacterium sp. s102 TaxID=2751212 RepID=UPI001BE886D4|nr:cupin domain-containing protein [Exiguobacterium sp. s102]
MKLYRFTKETGKKITKLDSDFVMSRITQTEKPVHIGCVHLDVAGLIGYHQAVVPQLLLLVSGEGWVRSEDDTSVKVQSGDAVFWDSGEWHETRTDSGLTAIVIESEELITSSLTPLERLQV